MDVRLSDSCRTVGLSDLSDLSDPHLTVSDSTRTCDRSELLSDTVGLLSDTVGPVGLSEVAIDDDTHPSTKFFLRSPGLALEGPDSPEHFVCVLLVFV